MKLRPAILKDLQSLPVFICGILVITENTGLAGNQLKFNEMNEMLMDICLVNVLLW